MQKSKQYKRAKFSARLIRKAIEACRAFATKDQDLQNLTVQIDAEEWVFDNLEEFLGSYSNANATSATFTFWWNGTDGMFRLGFDIDYGTSVRIKHNSKEAIESIFSTFEEASAEDIFEITQTKPKTKIRLFIGHGRNKQWEALKSHLQDKHKLEIVAYETGARAGHTIRDILDEMAGESSLALLVLTGEDKTVAGKMRARQNVIHECGLFQGRLGFDRAILLVEQDVELASNFDGIQQLRFKKGHISETFGDVLATIRREFGPI